MPSHIVFRNFYDSIKLRVKYFPNDNTLTDVFLRKISDDRYSITSIMNIPNESIESEYSLREHLISFFSEFPEDADRIGNPEKLREFSEHYSSDIIKALDILFAGRKRDDTTEFRDISYDPEPPRPTHPDDDDTPSM